MWQPNRRQWFVIWIAAVVLIMAWPPSEGSSLGIKTVRWAVDPADTLPTLPEQLPMGLADDGDAVAAHDFQESEYRRAFDSSKVVRARLHLKVVEDPFDPSTERQILAGFGILSALLIWRLGSSGRSDGVKE